MKGESRGILLLLLVLILHMWQGNIRVFCRVRPLLGEEVVANDNSDVIHHMQVLSVSSLELFKGDHSEYTFYYVIVRTLCANDP